MASQRPSWTFLRKTPYGDVSAAWSAAGGFRGIVERGRVFRGTCIPVGKARVLTLAGRRHGGSFQAQPARRSVLVLPDRNASPILERTHVFWGEQNRVPHLAVIFGTIPDFFLPEYTPRGDLRVNPEYLERYLSTPTTPTSSSRAIRHLPVRQPRRIRGLMSPGCISQPRTQRRQHRRVR